MSTGQAWAGFLGTYREAWGRRHSPLSLLTHAASGTLGCVRAGGMLTALRTCTAVEALWMSGGGVGVGGGALPLQPGGGVGSGVLAGDAELMAVHECVKGASALLGAKCMDAFVGLLASGMPPSQDSPATLLVCTVTYHLIFTHPTGLGYALRLHPSAFSHGA